MSRLAQRWQRGKAWLQETSLFKQVTQLIEWLSRNPLIVLGGIAFLFVVYIGFWHIPVGQLENLRAQHVVELYRIKATIRGTVAQAFGIVFLIVGLYFAWRRVLAAEEGQITERFTRAIEQLGHEKLEVRLGGIYALERIAKDSEKDHWQIIEVLTAYVRENAPRQAEDNKQEAKKPNEEPEENEPEKNSQKEETLQPQKPSTDIQAILTVLGRRERSYRNGENEPLNLIDTQLAWANLREANLSGANLEKAILTWANLRDAILREANLSGADLSGADLRKRDANRRETDLRDANLTGADLRWADLRGTDLYTAKNLTLQQIAFARMDKSTKLPDYLTEQDAPPAKQ